MPNFDLEHLEDDFLAEPQAQPDMPAPTFARLIRLLREELSDLSQMKEQLEEFRKDIKLMINLDPRTLNALLTAVLDKNLGTELSEAEIDRAHKIFDNHKHDSINDALRLVAHEISVIKNAARLLAVLDSCAIEMPAKWSNLPTGNLARSIAQLAHASRVAPIETA
ncbi:hypothetical protein [Ahrensia kielensis]|uniref:hypothetical protein n=1 Tax=Ahrensia kielensis TaxID=76980 RepID=UPI000380535A|nr:hypothetical protein [Ahrensia kielensis]